MILIATVIVIVILLIVLLFTEHFEEISNISSSSLNNLIDAYNDNKIKANTLSISDSINSKNIISNSISSETINSSNIISKSLNTDTLKTSSVESTDLKCNTINGLDIINGLTIHKCHIRIRDDDSSLKFEFDCYCIISKGYKCTCVQFINAGIHYKSGMWRPSIGYDKARDKTILIYGNSNEESYKLTLDVIIMYDAWSGKTMREIDDNPYDKNICIQNPNSTGYRCNDRAIFNEYFFFTMGLKKDQ